jgi:hypothetical protein
MSYPKPKFIATDLVPGLTYRVTVPFKDYDGVNHPAGETWRFIKKNFLPYEDGLTLFIERDGQETSFRLQWRLESQGHVIDNFSDFAAEI